MVNTLSVSFCCISNAQGIIDLLRTLLALPLSSSTKLLFVHCKLLPENVLCGSVLSRVKNLNVNNTWPMPSRRL